MAEKIYIYDTSLRDGGQMQGVDYSLVDKLEIAKALDELKVDFIEAGFAGANPTDTKFFNNLPELNNSNITSFGMTHRAGIEAKDDKLLNEIIQSGVKTACIFGKSSLVHAEKALGITAEENLKIIETSVAYLKQAGLSVMFDAEHFFDGFIENKEYALKALKSAGNSGAKWLVLCDTNGGMLPNQITEIISSVKQELPNVNIGIHCHNDSETAVANSLAAVQAGARMVQGTINGIGERCGNANLISLIPSLSLKLGFEININLEKLTSFSREFDERLNRQSDNYAPYVGRSAFAHKGGMHVSAVMKDSKLYEHINPKIVGNDREVIISNQTGRANVVNRLEKFGIKTDSKEKLDELVSIVKERENQGYSYDNAEASFELLARQTLENLPDFYKLQSFRVIDERRWNALDELTMVSEAKVVVELDGNEMVEISEGSGPVDALNKALMRVLLPKYPKLEKVYLSDFKVRIVAPEKQTEAITRVSIEMQNDNGKRWNTVGVSENIIDASYNALSEAIKYALLKK